jgi:acyl-coenzyme A synthetase/AMP-(fatty) acid ligase
MASIREALTDVPAPGVAGSGRTCLPSAARLADRSVLIATRDQVAAVLALIELDGVARRLTLCPPEVIPGRLAEIAAQVDADAIVTDIDLTGAGVDDLLEARPAASAACPPPTPHRDTEWLLLTSGTAGAAKLVRHTFATLTGAIPAPAPPAGQRSRNVWGTFYDVRRYGGLQVVFRALLGGGALVLGAPDDTLASYLDRLASVGVTHVTGTPTHWRCVLMSVNAGAIAPAYIRLSGEIADQAILDALRARYPRAHVAHAFASTEAGVGFDVNDGLAGFPAAIAGGDGDPAVRVDGGSLRLRSRRTALGYLHEAQGPLADSDGFVDTGDAVERRGDRYYFLGRRSGVINVGGLKVHPEEVEAAINRHPSVRMSKVRSKANPITGALVAADVVLERAADADGSRREILTMCRAALPPHKVPAIIRVVPALDLAATGKLARRVS